MMHLFVEGTPQQRELQHSFTSYSAGPELARLFFCVRMEAKVDLSQHVDIIMFFAIRVDCSGVGGPC